MNLLIIGTGMYVTGRSTAGIGTILPAAIKYGELEERELSITLLATSDISKKSAEQKIEKAKELLNFKSSQIRVIVGRLEELENLNEFHCAIIATPDATHFELAKILIKNKVHLLVVKPLASNISEVKTLIKLAEEKDVYGMVEFHKRFDRSNKQIKTVIENKDIGKPLYFLVQYSQKKVIPEHTFKKWIDQTNIFQYLGIHYVDIIYFATKAKPKRVLSIGQKSYLSSKGIDSYDSIQTLVEWECDDGHKFSSSFLTNWVEEDNAPAMSDQRIKVVGTAGRLEANQKDRGLKVVTSEGYEEVNPDFCRLYKVKDHYEIEGYGVESVITFLQDVEGLQGNKLNLDSLAECRPTFKESIVPTQVIEASNLSLSQGGQWVNIEQ